MLSFQCGWCPTLKRCSNGIDRKRNDWLLRGCDREQVVNLAECSNADYFNKQTIRTTDTGMKPTVDASSASRKSVEEEEDEEKGAMGTVMGVLIPFGLIFVAIGWVMYAYRNPHTKSGQFLIQVSDSCGKFNTSVQ